MSIITSRDNEKIKFTAKLLKNKSLRFKTNLFVVEGLRICHDAAQSGLIKDTFITETIAKRNLQKIDFISERSENFHIVSDHVIEKISDTKTTQGIVCVCKIKQTSLDQIDMEKSVKYLALENISDPGNMGTIVRTTEALGMTGVVLTGECADIYSPKVVRSTMGSIFRIPIYRCTDSIEFIEKCRSNGLTTWAALVSGDCEILSQTNLSDANVMFIGNEGNGLLNTTSDACDHRITIDMAGRAESINASSSAAILAWEMVR